MRSERDVLDEFDVFQKRRSGRQRESIRGERNVLDLKINPHLINPSSYLLASMGQRSDDTLTASFVVVLASYRDDLCFGKVVLDDYS